MILKKITIENIASIEKAVIDFAQPPLKDADLFLIHGETGSGKTTIIDAVCLALFDNTPRLKSAPNNRLNFGTYTLTSRDTANMLRHGALDAKSELEFEGNDGKEYTATWTAHSTKTRSSISTDHLLFHKGSQIARGMQVNNMIHGTILGMTFDDFCRTAVLAQGEFTKFLKSDDNEKSAILEKLTATEHFSEVGRTIYKMWKEKDDAYKGLKAQLEGIELLSTEDIQSIESSIKEVQGQVGALEKELDGLLAQRRWLQENERLSKAYAEALKAYNTAKELCETDEYVSETRMIADHRVSQQAMRCLENLRSNESKISQAVEQERQLAVCFGQASAGLDYLYGMLRQKTDELKVLETKITSQQPHKDMFEKAGAIVTNLQHARQTAKDAASERSKADGLGKKIAGLEKYWQDAVDAQGKAKLAVEEKIREVEDVQKKVDELNGKGITERNQNLQKQSQDLHEAALALQNFIDSMEKYEEVVRRIADLQKEITESIPKLEKLGMAKEEASEAYKRAEEVYRSISLASEKWAVEARAILNDGDKCPVCGNTFNAAHFDEVVTRVKEEESKRLQDAKKAKEDAEKEYNLLNAGLSQKNREKDELTQKDLVERQSSLHEVFEKATAVCQKAGIRLSDQSRQAYEQAVTEGKRLRTKLDGEIEENNKALDNLKSLNGSLASLNAQLSQLKDDSAKAAEAVAGAKNDLAGCRKDIEIAQNNAQKYAQQSREAVDEANGLITWPNWGEEWSRDQTGFEERLKAAAADYSEAKTLQARLNPQVAQLGAQLQGYNGQREELAKAWPTWVAFPSNRQFADGQARQWNELTTQAAAARQEKATAEAAVADCRKELSLFFVDHPSIDRHRLELLVGFDVQAVMKKHEKRDGDLKELEGALRTVGQNCEKHLALKPAEITVQTDEARLAEEIDELTKRRDELSQNIGAERQKLDADGKKRETYGKKQAELAAQKLILDKWTSFNSNYGDVNGTKFRRLAQQLIFDRLLQMANQHLSRLTARYSLKTIPGTLTISLCDQFTPGFNSSVHNLSGGESFMVSLSLALALSSMGREGISMDTLFIDEGFGTLSTENQVRVMDLLQTLQRTQGKRVGIISHVPYLLERIPIQIQVSRLRDDNTKSSVRVLTTTT